MLNKQKKTEQKQALYDADGNVMGDTVGTDTAVGQIPKKSLSKQKVQAQNQIQEDKEELIATSDFTPGRGYWFLMGLLVLVVIITGIKNVEQTQKRHGVYRDLSAVKQAYRTMRIEEERLIIEQQTFSATSTVAQRAVTELGMFYPSETHRIVVPGPKL